LLSALSTEEVDFIRGHSGMGGASHARTATQLTLSPFDADELEETSSAKPSIRDLAAAIASWLANPRRAAAEESSTIDPPCCAAVVAEVNLKSPELI